MNTRALPHLASILKEHAEVHLLWDERLTHRAFLAVGAVRSFTVHAPSLGDWIAWNAFMEETKRRKTWAFGWIAYDAHHTLEGYDDSGIPSMPPPVDGWPVMHWVEPEWVLTWEAGETEPTVCGSTTPSWVSDLQGPQAPANHSTAFMPVTPLEPLWTAEAYDEKFRAVQEALKRGDLYEMNLCMPWKGAAPGQDAWDLFERLTQTTRAPHSAFIQHGKHHVLSASPERFLRKEDSRLMSQPIKGTVRRGQTEEEDQQLRLSLANSEKERAENVMIVDLVRNDLSRVAQPASVEVDELFGVHSFATVHQLISSVSCELKPTASMLDIMRATFPMGSMTGAPKPSALQHIARLEEQGRGVYSGCIGYQNPEGDFDLNVVIRTLLQNDDTGEVHATVGGAITLLSEGGHEYDECLLKAEALRQCLNHEG